LDLRDLEVTLRAAGVQSPSLSQTLSQPITLKLGTLDASVANASHLILALRWAAPLAALILLFVTGVTARHHRWRLLGKTFLISAVLTSMLAVLAYLPSFVAPLITSGASTKLLQDAVRSLAAQIAAGQARVILYFAAGYAATGLLMFLIHPFAKLAAKRRARRPRRSEDSDYQPLPPVQDV
jgi:uncharacterized membrane protein YsdA (DUF1294 family)